MPSSFFTREQRLIHTIGRLLPGGADALSDDTFSDAESRLMYTADMLVEGRHFDWRWFSPFDLGWKAAAVNFSDIAATGGEPQYLLVSLALPEHRADTGFVTGLYEGLMACCKRYGGQIIGGDTVSAPLVVINVTATGRLPQGHTAGRRHAAQPGDVIVTTGFHGLSAAGLLSFQKNKTGFESARQHHLRPEPRVAEGLFLSKHFTRYALIDSSDGLADALLRMAHASGTDIRLQSDRLPVASELAVCPDAHDLMLYGGEDFELIAAIPEGVVSTTALADHGLTVIGRVEAPHAAEPHVILIDAQGQPLETLAFNKTYAHFEETVSP